MSRGRSGTQSSYRSSSAPAPLWPPDQSILDYIVNDRRLGEEVVGNRLVIVVAQIFEAVLDGLPHRALDLALLGRSAGLQQLDEVILFPFADPCIRVRRD